MIGLVLLLLTILIVLSIPAVQTRIAKKVTDYLNETYGTSISIDRLGLNWRAEVDIRGVYIEDHKGDTLIYSEEIQTNLLSIKTLVEGDLDFGYVDLTRAKLYVTTYKDEQTDNLTIFTDKFNTSDTTSGKPFKLKSSSISTLGTKVRIRNQNLENPDSVVFTNINLLADDFWVNGPEVSAAITNLELTEARGWGISSLQANFCYGPGEIRFDELDLKTEHSRLKGMVVLRYGPEGMSNFEDNVEWEARLEQTVVGTDDLNLFYNEFGRDLDITVDGTLTGTLNHFYLRNAKVRFGNSRLSGDYHFLNLVSDDVYLIESPNHVIATNDRDLSRLLPRILGGILPQQTAKFGNFILRGATKLDGDYIETVGDISTAVGSIKLDVELANIHDFSDAVYQGGIEFVNFDLGVLSGSESLGIIEADLVVSGKGFTRETVDTNINGAIDAFNFEGYTYRNIRVSGDLKDPLFNGELSINDPNLKMEFNGLVDGSKEKNQYDFKANIEFAELNKLNLFTRDSVSVFAGRVIMDMEASSIDDAVGTIEFVETFYQTETNDYFFDDFLVSAYFNEQKRTIEINSRDIINGTISGNFKIGQIPDLVYNSIGSIYTNFIPVEVEPDQYFDYNFLIRNKIIDVFVPELELGENTRLRGSVYSDLSKFKLDFRSPELLLYSNYLGKVNLQLDNDNPLYNAYISVDSVYTGNYNFKDVSLINKTLNDTLYLQSDIRGGREGQDRFKLALYHTINPEGKSVIGIKRSTITYKQNEWLLNRNNNNLNKLTFDNGFQDVLLDSLMMSHNEEYIYLSGIKKDSSYANINLRFKDVDPGKLMPPIDSLDVHGIMNGQMNIVRKQKAFIPTSQILVDHLTINDQHYGNLDLDISGNSDLSEFTISSELINEQVKSFTAKGMLYVAENRRDLDMDLNFDRFDISGLSALGGDVLSNMRGALSGRADVIGNYRKPDISGSLSLRDGGMSIPYLNVDLDLQERTNIFVQPDQFRIPNITITDTKYQTQSQVNTVIRHDYFTNWSLDMDLVTDRMLVLDTPPEDDALYYGTAFISGEATIKGPFDELVIDVVATTEEGTSFKIPISDEASIGDDSFVRFISPEEKEARISGETIVKEELKGLSLNFELDINENALVEIVVDQKNNSRLIGRGAGTLLLEINTLGKFNMWGDFLVIEGTYDFRYGGLIDKTIDMVPGGNITWNGSPTGAMLDLTAKYKTDANPSVLLDNPAVNRNIPVEVLVNLNGIILQPELDFDIDFPKVSSTVRSELEYKLQTKEQRQTQALFLFSTGSFQGDTNYGSDAVVGTLAESVNKMVADIFTANDPKFVVLPYYEPGTRSIDLETEDQFGVRVSTKISERILIDGQVGIPVGGANESTIAGDIEVQWLVNEDGSLRMNFFNRQADLQFFGEDQIYEQGLGVTYSVDFDTFKELMRILFNKELTIDKELQESVVPDDNNYPVFFKPPTEDDGGGEQ